MSMGDLAGPVVDVVSCAWPLVSERAGYVCKLEENLESLEFAKENLELDYEDIKEKVEKEEKLPKKRTKKVESWLKRVEKLLEDVRTTLVKGDEEKQKKCLSGGCPKNCWSSYKLGKRVCKLIVEVDKRRSEGRVDQLGDLTLKEHPTIKEQSVDETVGLDSKVEEVWKCIEDPNLGIIGLYGIKWVGKTTLLKKINNEFLKKEHDFKTVIWVDAKQPEQKLQEIILTESGISVGDWENTSIAEKASQITRILRCQKFVLLLDDVVKRLELLKIGVPLPNAQNKSKVVFTTLTEQVCAFMDSVKNIEVKCLSPADALDLFRKKVGEPALKFPDLAEKMASLCKGLPYILITVGRAMALRKTAEDWKAAIKLLERDPSKIAGMSAVPELLETSFDSMLDPNLKLCFTYCYMFPECYNIRKEQLIEYWIREGFLDGYDVGSSRRALGEYNTRRALGEYNIGSLKQCCLLESDESGEFVRMHDVIYGMNFWGYKKKVLILTQRGANLNEAHRDWNEVDRISLWDHNIQDLPIKHLQYDKIKTLFCKAPNLKQFPPGFFKSMLALRVLDLSDSSDLGELPGEIGSLICLEYLNLSRTAVVEMPIVLQKLTKMKCLVLDYVKNLQEIPRAVISELRLLEVFSNLVSLIKSKNLVSSNKRCSAECLLEDLELLPRMSEICIAIENYTSVQRLLRSQKLQRCIRKISLFYCEDLASIELSPSLLSRIEHLEFFNCIDLKELKISPESESAQNHSFDHLCNVKIVSGQFSDVTWLTYAPSLKTLTLIDCKSMEEVILGVHQDIFSSLTALHLEDLPCLKSICQHALPFQSLTKIEVQQCPRLEKLPFGSNSAKKSPGLITGERRWWDGLKWEDEAIRQEFSSAFVER